MTVGIGAREQIAIGVVGGLCHMAQSVGYRQKPADVVKAEMRDLARLVGRGDHPASGVVGWRGGRAIRVSGRNQPAARVVGKPGRPAQRVGRGDAPPVGVVSLGCALAQRAGGLSALREGDLVVEAHVTGARRCAGQGIRAVVRLAAQVGSCANRLWRRIWQRQRLSDGVELR